MARAKTAKELKKKREKVSWAEGIIATLQEAGQNKRQWYEEQIENEQQNMRAVEVRLNTEMGQLEALHDKRIKTMARGKGTLQRVRLLAQTKIRTSRRLSKRCRRA